jgi:integrase
VIPGFEYLSDEQIRQVLDGVVHARDRLLVVLLAVTGVRIGEALGLRRETVGNGPERRSGASRSARSTMPSSIGTGRSRSTTMFLLRKAFKIVFSNDAAGVRSDERGALRRALRRRGRAGRGSLSPIRASPPFEPCR